MSSSLNILKYRPYNRTLLSSKIEELKNGLIDEIGNLRTAIKKARELAKLPDDAPSMLVRDKGKPIGAQLAEKNPAAQLKYIVDNVELMTNRAQYLLPFDWRDS